MWQSRIENFVFSSRVYCNLVLFCVVFLLSSVLYICVDWYWFYNSRATEKELDSVVVLRSIREIADSNVETERVGKRLTDFIAIVDANIKLTASVAGKEIFNFDNRKYIDTTRTQVIKLDSFDSNGVTYAVKYQYSNRPGVIIAMWRAWSFSLYDLVKKPDIYFKYKLYNRSTPLLACFIIVGAVCLLWFKYWRRIYKENSELLTRFESIKQTLDKTVNERDTRRSEIERLVTEKEHEQESLRQQLEDHSVFSNEVLMMMQEKEKSLEEENEILRIEKNEIEQQLSSLNSARAEMERDINTKDSTISELSTRLQKYEQIMRSVATPGDADKIKIGKDSRVFRELKKQLLKWIEIRGTTKISLADHGTRGTIEKYISKIDSDYLNDFFVIVKNEEYGPAEKASIKVTVAPEGVKDYSGTISVYLDKDSGCCIALSFKTKEKAPTEKVGFVLAIMLRAVCKEFADYRIR